MRHHLLTAALAAGGFLAAGGTADAQYGSPYRPGGGYHQPHAPAPRYHPPFAPAQPYAPPAHFQPPAHATRYAPAQYPLADPYPGYGGAGYGPQAGGGEAEFVRSLYHRHLGREPDPQGMDTWLRRLADVRGDADRVTREFLTAAQRELDSNRYPPPSDRYGPPAHRPRRR